MPLSDGAPAPTSATRDRILDVALTVLGQRPNAGVGEIAAAAGVVRRTVYGHFPGREELVRTIAQSAADELRTALSSATTSSDRADLVWVDYVARVWPLAHRYRVLLMLRRSEHSDDIHAQLTSVEHALTELVRRGQEEGTFGRHLPADTLARLAQSTVFTLADAQEECGSDVTAAAITSLLVLGVPESDARALAHTGLGDAPSTDRT